MSLEILAMTLKRRDSFIPRKRKRDWTTVFTLVSNIVTVTCLLVQIILFIAYNLVLIDFYGGYKNFAGSTWTVYVITLLFLIWVLFSLRKEVTVRNMGITIELSVYYWFLTALSWFENVFMGILIECAVSIEDILQSNRQNVTAASIDTRDFVDRTGCFVTNHLLTNATTFRQGNKVYTMIANLDESLEALKIFPAAWEQAFRDFAFGSFVLMLVSAIAVSYAAYKCRSYLDLQIYHYCGASFSRRRSFILSVLFKSSFFICCALGTTINLMAFSDTYLVTPGSTGILEQNMIEPYDTWYQVIVSSGLTFYITAGILGYYYRKKWAMIGYFIFVVGIFSVLAYGAYHTSKQKSVVAQYEFVIYCISCTFAILLWPLTYFCLARFHEFGEMAFANTDLERRMLIE
ncbi:hypothetical protein EDD86DRAFT_218927 [Gorgonomyces haynaldii]|nr:hypothetical protein EDD86DRAFT_218927 [Gorgonomyces haynaldii]